MASYPGSIFSQTDPTGTNLVAVIDHGLQHKNVNDELNGLEIFLGTNSASNGIFGAYTAGQLPLAEKGGTIQKGILGTINLTGNGTNFGTIANGAYKNPSILISSDATGDLYYRNSGGSLTNLAIGGTGQILTVSTGGTLPSWAAPPTSGFGTSGWAAAGETWTMLGTTTNIGTLQVTATASNKYDKGDKVTFSQGGTTMYGYIYALPTGTTALITAGTNFVYGTSAITNPQYSKAATPNGFPYWFGYVPTYTGFSSVPVGTVLFRLDGQHCFMMKRSNTTGTSNSIGFTMTAPVPANAVGVDFWVGGIGRAFDNGTASVNPCRIYIQAGATIITLELNNSTANWTATGLKDAEFLFNYFI